MMMMKKSLKFVPWIGWTHFFQGSLFLNRNWEKDQKALNKKFEEMNNGDFPRPFLIGVYPEGTRPTKKKLEESKAFLESRGLPMLNHVLAPRPKGFLFIMKNVRETCKYLIDATIVYEDVPMYALDLILKGRYQTKRIHIHTRVFNTADLPTDPKDLEMWLYNTFAEKDKLMAYWKQNKCFPGKKFSIPLETGIFIKIMLAFYLLLALALGSLFGWLYGVLGLLLTVYSILTLKDGFSRSAEMARTFAETHS
jgi:lysophosphatidic acid acyltransferase / lysophosphatidylinositol acyltransferase